MQSALCSTPFQVGAQRKGVEAGSRIRWPNGYAETVPEYYDAIGNATYPGAATRNIIYLGCFRDHSANMTNTRFSAVVDPLPSNSLNNSDGEGHIPEQYPRPARDERKSNGREAEQNYGLLYVFPRSLTPEVRRHVGQDSGGAKDFSDWRVGFVSHNSCARETGV